MREPLNQMQQAMLKAVVRASMAKRKPAFAPLGLIPQSTRANETFVPEKRVTRPNVSRVTTTGGG